jgi:hypothetical protein
MTEQTNEVKDSTIECEHCNTKVFNINQILEETIEFVNSKIESVPDGQKIDAILNLLLNLTGLTLQSVSAEGHEAEITASYVTNIVNWMANAKNVDKTNSKSKH